MTILKNNGNRSVNWNFYVFINHQKFNIMIEVIVRLLQAVLMFFITVVVSTLIGAISGWTVGLFFGDTILAVLATIGISGFTMWQIGAFLGFVASFFRPLFNYNKNVIERKNPENPNINIRARR